MCVFGAFKDFGIIAVLKGLDFDKKKTHTHTHTMQGQSTTTSSTVYKDPEVKVISL